MAIDAVALSGLVIALVALVISLFQLLQQLFATADGYRNCQSAVIGPFAKLTNAGRCFGNFEFGPFTRFPTSQLATAITRRSSASPGVTSLGSNLIAPNSEEHCRRDGIVDLLP